MRTKSTFSAYGRPSDGGGRVRLGPEEYLALRDRMLISVPIALIMAAGGGRHDGLGAVNHDFYVLLLTFLINYLMGFGVIAFAHWSNRWLDSRTPWNERFDSRLVWQVALPLTGSLMLGLLMACGVDALTGGGSCHQGYWDFEAWFFLSVLLAFNAGYGLWFLHRRPQAELAPSAYVQVQERQGRQVLISERSVGYATSSRRGAIVHLLDGRQYASRERIAHLAKKFDERTFLMVQRKFLINIRIIKGVQTIKIPRADQHGQQSNATRVDYRNELIFGNDHIEERRVALVKGSLTRVRAWLQRNAPNADPHR